MPKMSAAALIGALLVVGCAPPAAAPVASQPVTAPRPAAVDPLASLLAAQGPIGVTEIATVVFVIDGDTIRVQKANDEFNEYTVRYIGIDAPERETEPLWQESTQANEELIAGREIFMEPDVSDTDQHGRLLRHIWLPNDNGWLNINREMVRLGMAQAKSYPPDTLWDAEYNAAESEARGALRGIWATPDYPR